MQNVKYSVVVPVYNEAENLNVLHRQIVESLGLLNGSSEIIFVNDGSTDASLSIMKEISPLIIVNLRKNFGQTAALDAGIKQARGEIVITIDSDLQNPPAEIPKLVKALEKTRVDAISGWRQNRQDPFFKKINSKIANQLRWFLIHDGVHDSGCTLKVYRRECLGNIELYGELHRFIPALLKIQGFRVLEVPVKHQPRYQGKTKYNWKRGFKGVLDMLAVWFWLKYSARPLHFFGGLGIITIFASLICGGTAIYYKIAYNRDLSDTALTPFAGFLFLFGILFMISGLLADMIIKNRYAIIRRPPYNIKEVIKQD